jgi:hypothetical protein
VLGKIFYVVGFNRITFYDKFWYELPFYLADLLFVIMTHFVLLPSTRVISPTVLKYLEECAKQNAIKNDLPFAAERISRSPPPTKLSEGTKIELGEMDPKSTPLTNGQTPIKTNYTFPTETQPTRFDSIPPETFDFWNEKDKIRELSNPPKPDPKTLKHMKNVPTYKSFDSETGLATNPVDTKADVRKYLPDFAQKLGVNFDSFTDSVQEMNDAEYTRKLAEDKEKFSIFATPPAPPRPNPFLKMEPTKLDTQAVDIEKNEDVQFKDGKFQKVVMEVVNKDSAWYKLRNHLVKFRGTKVDLSESTVAVLYHEAYKWCEDRHMQPDQSNECVNKALMYLVQDEPERTRILQVINLLSVKEVNKPQA